MTAPPYSSVPPLLSRGGVPAKRAGWFAAHVTTPRLRRTPPQERRGKPVSALDHALAACRSITPSPPAARSRLRRLRSIISAPAARSPRRRLPREPELDHAARDGLGLLHVREMPRVGDLLEFRPGNALAVAPAVSERREAVLRAPQKQGRDADAVQPRPELRVVHVGIPREERGCLAVARHRGQLVLRQRLVVAQPHRGVAERELLPTAARRGEDVHDVALVARAEFRADRPDQNEARQAL